MNKPPKPPKLHPQKKRSIIEVFNSITNIIILFIIIILFALLYLSSNNHTFYQFLFDTKAGVFRKESVTTLFHILWITFTVALILKGIFYFHKKKKIKSNQKESENTFFVNEYQKLKKLQDKVEEIDKNQVVSKAEEPLRHENNILKLESYKRDIEDAHKAVVRKAKYSFSQIYLLLEKIDHPRQRMPQSVRKKVQEASQLFKREKP